MKYWKAPCQEQSSTSSKMDWITSDCLKRPCLPYQQRAHCKVWHIVIILLLVYKNMVMSVMSRVCPDKSCYDCYILSLVPHTKIQGDHFHLVFFTFWLFQDWAILSSCTADEDAGFLPQKARLSFACLISILPGYAWAFSFLATVKIKKKEVVRQMNALSM